MKRQLKKIVCLALITSMILGQKTLKTTKNVTAKEKKDIKIAIDAGHQARGNFAMEPRSEERRVGKECRSRWSPYH